MVKIYLAKHAKLDLTEIRQYTVDRRGIEQARKYIRLIYQRANDLASGRLQGKLREDIAPNLKSYHVGRHIIFYTQSENIMKIARILHEQMDFSRHL
ncbi:type II toxin-antitoxin system RelE/ParE family toxin [candidate division KSB1 bacterium]|nr:type II toxin-antitoxin system RelE/ParE family toxin [candidate division KSB1 bacterium]MBL7093506.1 type II toxin-antitoxin system RelE/ParE family toxin [candidate division KSB1 bacterium]